jgi:hypothetical protein
MARDDRAERRPALTMGAWGIAMILLPIFLWLASPARAADAYAFDPALSLTGDTSTSPSDEVPDPGPAHPPKKFDGPCGIAVDGAGDVYVASAAAGNGSGTDGRIDVFDRTGHFLTEISNSQQPCSVAVDSTGVVYVGELKGETGAFRGLVKYVPSAYPPMSGTVYAPPTPMTSGVQGIAVDASNDHLFVIRPSGITEYDSNEHGSTVIGEGYGEGELIFPKAVDVDGTTHDLYVTDQVSEEPFEARVRVLAGATHKVVAVMDGSNTPAGSFGYSFGNASVAIDQVTGDFFVTDLGGHKLVDQFTAARDYIGCIGVDSSCTPVFNSFIESTPPRFSDIAINETNGYIYVTSGTSAPNSHVYAFAPLGEGQPAEIKGEGASQVSDTEALLEAQLNPNGLATAYRFEYTTQADFEANGFANAARSPVPDATMSPSGFFARVSTPIASLLPDTTYRFRLVASNQCEPVERCVAEGIGGQFTTYPPRQLGLPDDRGYELVTPPDTGGRIPTAAILGEESHSNFPVQLASLDGSSVLFGVEGGSLPGLPGGGYNDTYVAERDGAAGWRSRFNGLTGAQAPVVGVGGVAAEHGYAFLRAIGSDGTLAGPKESAYYLREPSGAVVPVGRGSGGIDPDAVGKWIAEGGGHVIFTSGEGAPVRLEPAAAPVGTTSIYDRTGDGITHVVSLLPGGATPQAGEEAAYQGASQDGSSVVFKLGPEPSGEAQDERPLLVRRNDSKTEEVAHGLTTFAGVSADGRRVFYLEGGDIFAFDTESEETTPIGSSGNSILVNISADGSHVYFSSTSGLDTAGAGVPGEDNLYVWDESTIRFVAILADEDFVGEPIGTGFMTGSLGQWTSDAASPDQGRFRGPANDPSRTTPDGRVFVFESHANLAPPYDSQGHAEVYRYDSRTQGLLCISCTPTGVPATADARLQSRGSSRPLSPFPPVNAITPVANVTIDGSTIFFQSDEPLVAGDVDETTDVYMWRADGAAGCARARGCLFLISSGHSPRPNYLYAVSADGNDVFFLTEDVLVPQDSSGSPSIYDARVGGGFAVAATPEPCDGEACQGEPTVPPPPPALGTAEFRGRGNVGKSKHRKRTHGKRRNGGHSKKGHHHAAPKRHHGGRAGR